MAVFYPQTLASLSILAGPQSGDRVLPANTLPPIARAVRNGAVFEPETLSFTDPPTPRWLLPCSGDWTERDGECRPPTPVARMTCPAGEVQHRTATTCAPIGRPCAGEWPSPLPAAPLVRFVHPGGAPGPAGAISFATLAEALIGAPSGSVIALSRGLHSGEVTMCG